MRCPSSSSASRGWCCWWTARRGCSPRSRSAGSSRSATSSPGSIGSPTRCCRSPPAFGWLLPFAIAGAVGGLSALLAAFPALAVGLARIAVAGGSGAHSRARDLLDAVRMAARLGAHGLPVEPRRHLLGVLRRDESICRIGRRLGSEPCHRHSRRPAGAARGLERPQVEPVTRQFGARHPRRSALPADWRFCLPSGSADRFGCPAPAIPWSPMCGCDWCKPMSCRRTKARPIAAPMSSIGICA